MDYYRLIEGLIKYGEVQICKEGYVFTVLITGRDLDNVERVNSIQGLIIDEVGEDYPLIECVKNGFSFFLMVLKPEDKK